MGEEVDIKAMIEGLEGSLKVEEEPPGEPAPEPEPTPEPEPEPAPEPEPEPTPEPAPEPEPGPDLMAQLQAENEKLRLSLNSLAKQIRTPAPTPPTAQPQAQAPVVQAPVETKAEAEQIIAALLSDEEADLLIDKPKEILVKLANRILQAAEEKVFTRLPSVVNNVARQQIAMYQKGLEFYRKNSDLEKYEDFCVLTATQLENENPDWSVDKIYEETAVLVRERLGLKQEAERRVEEKSTPPASSKPAFPGQRPSRKPSGGPQMTEEQKVMVGMLDLANL
jgi:hypothetical protein